MKHGVTALTLIILLSIGTFAGVWAKAYWTGKSKIVTTVTGRQARSCEYDYNGQKFWRVFEYTCPSTVDVY